MMLQGHLALHLFCFSLSVGRSVFQFIGLSVSLLLLLSLSLSLIFINREANDDASLGILTKHIQHRCEDAP